MIDIFRNLLHFLKFKKTCVEDLAFRLHCKYTSMLLLFCFLIVTTKQIVGEPIDCDSNRDFVKGSVLNTYCLIHHTYLIRNAFNRQLGKEVAYPGLREGTDEIKYPYYQWIWFIYFIEALFFYTPHWFWKNLESETMDRLLNWECHHNQKDSRCLNRCRKTHISKCLVKYRKYDSYARNYLSCSLLALFNAFLQIFLIDLLFNGEFYSYGLNVFSFILSEPESKRDALTRVFPKMTKCMFHKYGSGGSIQTFDSLCILPLNMYNEKIFIFLWFWFAIISVVLMIKIAINVTILFSPYLRSYYFKRTFPATKSMTEDFDLRKVSFGQLFMLFLIKENKGIEFTNKVIDEVLPYICGKISSKGRNNSTLISKVDKHEEIV
ncbi:innexin shaking-B-like [Oppia nitens]|uniref:innexin shaking-B-like n=1 Tax=Oppia nitens TaxID=1686743 RepID=UPI0023DAFFB2|nr:innexin shaking-B-like [Oppia nitens]